MAGEEVAVIPSAEETPLETPQETPEVTPSETPTETPALETPGLEKPAEPAGPSKDDIDLSGVTDPKETLARIDKGLAALKKSHPVLAKALGDRHFRLGAYEKEYPTVQAARQARATLEAVGGEEGLGKLNEELDDWRQEADDFAAGKPEFLEGLYGTTPESAQNFGNQVANSLDLIKSKNMTLFDDVVVPHMVDRLESVQFGTRLDQLIKFIEEGKGQEAYDQANHLRNWLANTKSLAKKVLEGRTQRDPKADFYKQKDEEYAKKDREGYNREFSSHNDRLNDSAVGKETAKFFRDLGMAREGQREFKNTLISRIYKVMGQDKNYLRTAAALRTKGDMARHSQFVHDKFAEILPEAFRKLRNEMYPNYNPAKPGAAPAKVAPAKPGEKPAAPAPKVTSVNGQRPKREDVDWKKTSDTEWIAGRAYLTNGKYVQWKWADVKG